MLGDKFFAPEETATMEKYMALAMEASRKSQAGVGVAVVNPSRASVLAVAVGDSSHPLKHAVMVAVDLVAGLQGGGAWSTAPSGCLTYNTKKADLEVDNKVPYLCTGYDFYMTHEPCTMLLQVDTT